MSPSAFSKADARPADPGAASRSPSNGHQGRGVIAVADRQVGAPAGRVSLMSESLVLSSGVHLESLEPAVVVQSSEMDQLAWMRNFQLVSIRQPAEVDHLRFGTAPTNLRPDARRLGVRSEPEATVEMTSFRFVK
jgi:hypothetical protein